MSVALQPADTRTPWAELRALVQSPKELLAARLADPPPPQWLLAWRVGPWAAVRPAAVLLRSLVAGTPLAGFVLGLGSFALQVGTWLGLALVLPALARQFHADIGERQAFTLATYASIPLWLAGVLFVVPEEPDLLFVWSRLLVMLVATFSLYITRLSLAALGVERRQQLPLLGVIAAAAILIHGTLYVLLGVGSNVVLYVLG